MNEMILNAASKAAANLLDRVREDVGDQVENEQVRIVMNIGLTLAEKVGGEAFDIVEAILDGKPFDNEVLAENLSLLEVSNLLDVAQGLEARQRESVKRIISASRGAALQIASTFVKAALVAL